MIRTHMLALATALAVVAPLGWAAAQTPANGGTKCGPEAWSTEKMRYTRMPCVGGETGAASTNAVGTTTPNAAQTGTGVTTSSSMTKQEIKQGGAMNSMGYGAPMAPQMAQGSAYASSSDQCDLRAVAMKDEYGRKYNCRGDRVR